MTVRAMLFIPFWALGLLLVSIGCALLAAVDRVTDEELTKRWIES